LFSILERLFPITLGTDDQPYDGFAEQIRFGVHREAAPGYPANDIGSLTVEEPSDNSPPQRRSQCKIVFANDPEVPTPFRGREVATSIPSRSRTVRLDRGQRVLASTGDSPLWSVWNEGGARHFSSAMPLPHVEPHAGFSSVFTGGGFLEALPLLQFLREASSRSSYRPPPLRAAYVIDDPNLHWPRYGFVDYREVARHAERYRYHVAFATIPIDTWFTHAKTAEIFRRERRQLSLLIHGNNHAKNELAKPYSATQRRQLLQQAVNRIKRLEFKTGLDVCKVMVPPHGACSEELLADLPEAGFESACISAGSLRGHNRGKPWCDTLGFFCADVIEGCPVLPRWALDSNARNASLVAAYLGQPMILRGHHRDLKGGIEILDEHAGFINSFGPVAWSNMTGLSRLSYLSRSEGTRAFVKPLGVENRVELPAGTTHLVIDGTSATERAGWQVMFPDQRRCDAVEGEAFPLRQEDGNHIVLRRPPKLNLRLNDSAASRTTTTLVLRRLLTELRDRLSASW
jgi:hypothetical protein